MISTGLITFLLSTVVGAVFKLIASKMDNTRLIEEAKLRALNAQAVIVDDARRYENKGFQITRRVIAISATLSILVLPIVAPLMSYMMYPVEQDLGMHLNVTFCYDLIVSGFWPFTDSITETICNPMKGVVITPEHWNIMNSIIGLYFGTAIAKR